MSVHIYVRGSKVLQWIFLSLVYLYKVGHTNFSADFWTIRKFLPQFRENCGAI